MSKSFLLLFFKKEDLLLGAHNNAYMGAMKRFLTALLIALPLSAHALESAPVKSDHTTASLVSEADSFAPGKALRIGLRLKIQPGWHTYWANPGDAGAPPTLDVTGAAAGPIQYPTPLHTTDGPFTSFVYLNQVLLPVTVTPPAGAASLHLQAHGTWLVCEKVCVPEEASFTLDIPRGSGAPGADAGAFAATDAASPRPSPFAAHFAADGTLRVEAAGLTPKAVYFFPEEAGVIDQGAPQPFTVDASGVSVHLKALKPLDTGKALAGVLMLTDQGGQTEALAVRAVAGPMAASGRSRCCPRCSAP